MARQARNTITPVTDRMWELSSIIVYILHMNINTRKDLKILIHELYWIII